MDGFRNLELPELKSRISLLKISPTFKVPHDNNLCPFILGERIPPFTFVSTSTSWGGYPPEDHQLKSCLINHFKRSSKRSIFWKVWRVLPRKLTWNLKWTSGKGDSFWKPSFSGSMLVLGGVLPTFKILDLLKMLRKKSSKHILPNGVFFNIWWFTWYNP